MIHVFGHRISFPVALTSGFLILIIIGGLLLSLPLAAAKGVHTNLSDAFFVATSAVCVTGLTTVTTATHWLFWGQLILICLVEVGGTRLHDFCGYVNQPLAPAH